MSIVLRGGEWFDVSAGAFRPGDVRVGPTIEADAPVGPHDTVVDVAGLLVTPGLVDLHAHLFAGQDLGLLADEIGPPSGTTTYLDTGSAGAHLIGAFRRAAVEPARTRIRALLNIASVGTTSILLGGELKAPYYANEDAAVEAVEANRDLVIGVKVRASADVGGDNAPEALRRARRVADRVGLPLMVHLGPPPAQIDEILGLLRGGDILTHAFTGWAGNTVVEAGALRASVRAARDRGVLLDIGHGMSGLSLEVARTMVELGEFPDTISTDLHAYSQPVVRDFPTVLSKFLALGMPLADVIARATAAPARAMGLSGIGTLDPGAHGDVAVLRIVQEEIEFGDGFGGSVSGASRLECVLTISGGEIVYRGPGLAAT